MVATDNCLSSGFDQAFSRKAATFIFKTKGWVLTAVGAVGVAFAALPLLAADDAAPGKPARMSETVIKQLFAEQCSWCHGAYEMKAAKGPQLAGTQMAEKPVFDLIKNGQSGFMPSFKKALSDRQIAAISEYIKILKSETSFPEPLNR